MKYKKIKFVCFFLTSTIAISLLGCTNDSPEKGYTKNTETSSSVETEHFHEYAIEVVASSCTEKGYTSYICDCGESYMEASDVLGHSYEILAVDPTADSQGYIRYTCSRCDNSNQEPVVSYSDAWEEYLLPLKDFSRERKYAPEFVMIHFSSAVMLSKDDPYNMDAIRSIFVDYEVSTHYIIDRNGEIYCYIPENLVAIHAGYGTWGNDPKYTDLLNEYTIGIEIAAIGSQNDMKQYLSTDAYNSLDQSIIGYTDEQYDALKELVQDICQRNNIPMDREHIIGHEEYSPKKTDPGELFDWNRLFS